MKLRGAAQPAWPSCNCGRNMKSVGANEKKKEQCSLRFERTKLGHKKKGGNNRQKKTTEKGNKEKGSTTSTPIIAAAKGPFHSPFCLLSHWSVPAEEHLWLRTDSAGPQ